MGHGVAAAALAALVWYWLRSYGSERPGRWLLVGFLVGAAALMRWQLAAFAILPAGEALLKCGRAWCARPRRLDWKPLLGLGLAAPASAAAFFPQMVAWRCVYGHWLVAPLSLASNWLRPSLWHVLASQDRSLFYWTPLTLIACLGYFTLLRRVRRPDEPPAPGTTATRGPLLLLASAVALQVYALASIQGPGVFLGSSYGFRPLTEAVVALAPGLAFLLEGTSPRGYRLLVR